MLQHLMAKMESVEAVPVAETATLVVRVAKPGKKPYAVLRVDGQRVFADSSADACIEHAVSMGATESTLVEQGAFDSGQYVEVTPVGGVWRLVRHGQFGRYVMVEVQREPG